MEKISRLLIVDDEVPLRTLFTMALESDECIAESAASGREALDSMEEKSYDLVLLDLSMPGLSGLDVLRQMRVRRDFSMVMIVSAFIPGSAVLKAVSMGVTEFLGKPMKLQSLREIVSRQLGLNNPSPMDRAKQAARKLDFQKAVRILHDSDERMDLQSSIWLELFESLSAGNTINDLGHLTPKLKLLVNS